VQTIEHDVAVVNVVRVGAARSVFQQNQALHAEFGSRSSGLARMIGLSSALGDNNISPSRNGLSHKEFKLSRLITARSQARAIIALDPKARATQQGGELGHGF
jgi:hypothetical protein